MSPPHSYIYFVVRTGLNRINRTGLTVKTGKASVASVDEKTGDLPSLQTWMAQRKSAR